MVLGAFIQGFEVENRQFAGGMFDWLTPFSLLTGAALISGYALLGATWLIMKTERELQDRCYRLARGLLLAVLAFIGIVSLWTPLLNPEIAERWFTWPNIAWLSPVPVVTALVAFALWRALEQRREVLPFVLSLALFLLSFLGLGISLWPNVIPPDISIWEAAAPPETQLFILIGTAILLPIILAYTGFTYFVFRGKAPQPSPARPLLKPSHSVVLTNPTQPRHGSVRPASYVGKPRSLWEETQQEPRPPLAGAWPLDECIR